MGLHVVNPDRRYARLQERLDRNVTGAPDSPATRRTLEILFTPEDAELATQVPTKPIRVEKLLEPASPVKAALAIAPLRSALLSASLPLARLATGGLSGGNQ